MWSHAELEFIENNKELMNAYPQSFVGSISQLIGRSRLTSKSLCRIVLGLHYLKMGPSGFFLKTHAPVDVVAGNIEHFGEHLVILDFKLNGLDTNYFDSYTSFNILAKHSDPLTLTKDKVKQAFRDYLYGEFLIPIKMSTDISNNCRFDKGLEWLLIGDKV